MKTSGAEPVEQAHLADRVGNVDIGRRASGCAALPSAGATLSPACAASAAISGAAMRMPRREDGEEVRMARGERPVHAPMTISSSPGWVLAASQTGRPGDQAGELRHGARIGGRRRARRI